MIVDKRDGRRQPPGDWAARFYDDAGCPIDFVFYADDLARKVGRYTPNASMCYVLDADGNRAELWEDRFVEIRWVQPPAVMTDDYADTPLIVGEQR
jgi:hypothetical protein